MTSLRRYIPIAAVGALLSLGLVLSGCDSNAPTEDGDLVESQDLNVAERIDVQGDLGTLKSALQDAKLLDSLRNEGTQFTVFAPALDDVNANAMKDLGIFNDVLQYHVVAGQALSSGDLSGTVETLSGDQLEFGDGTVNGAPIVETDLPASNGVVHRVGRTLLENQTVRARLAVTSETQTYNDALVANENDDPSLEVDYSGDGITVFAPNESAWIEWDDSGSGPIGDGLFNTPGLLSDLLEYHMIDEELTAADLQSIASGAGAVETMAGDSLDVSTTSNGAVTIDDARVVTPDLEGTNGIVHILGARPSPAFYSVLGAPIDILEGVPTRQIMTVEDRVNNSVFTIFSSLGALFSSAPLGDPTASFTAIIPTNGAFNAAGFNTDNLFNGFDDSNPYIPANASFFAGRKVFDGHLIQGSVLSSDDLVDNGTTTYTTVNGNPLPVQVDGDSISVTGEYSVTSTDLEVNNGVIHYISDGLIQTQLLVPERVLFSSPLSTAANGIYETGRAGSPFSPGVLNQSDRTFFAPTDDAFSALPSGVPKTLLRKETTLLGKILDYHILTSSESAEDLAAAGEGATFTTRQGQDIEITATGPPLEINGVPVQQADSASNGFLHTIGGVLLPDAASAFNLVESSILNGYLQFRTALEVTSNRSDVESGNGFTVVTPTDGAFQAFLDNLGASDLRSLRPEEESALDTRLLLHVATRELSAEDIQSQLAGPGDVFTVETLLSQATGVAGDQLAFSIRGGSLVVGSLRAQQDPDRSLTPISQANIEAENGFAHGIETILER